MQGAMGAEVGMGCRTGWRRGRGDNRVHGVEWNLLRLFSYGAGVAAQKNSMGKAVVGCWGDWTLDTRSSLPLHPSPSFPPLFSLYP